MLEDASGAPVRIAQAYIYYASTGRRKTVPLTDELRQLTIQTIAAVRTLLHTRQRPEVGYNPRCKGCSLYNVCLPRETAMLKSHA
jgi:CRISPR-associated exonuclease Cas4